MHMYSGSAKNLENWSGIFKFVISETNDISKWQVNWLGVKVAIDTTFGHIYSVYIFFI